MAEHERKKYQFSFVFFFLGRAVSRSIDKRGDSFVFILKRGLGVYPDIIGQHDA